VCALLLLLSSSVSAVPAVLSAAAAAAGHYVATEGLMEQDLMDKMLGWLDGQQQQQAGNSSEPFFMYYAPNAIHQCVAVTATQHWYLCIALCIADADVD
jgi:hypothetical protein